MNSKIGKQIKFRKSNGQFRQATLKDFGIQDAEINDGKEHVCEKCKQPSRPIMKIWNCVCGHTNGKGEVSNG